MSLYTHLSSYLLSLVYPEIGQVAWHCVVFALVSWSFLGCTKASQWSIEYSFLLFKTDWHHVQWVNELSCITVSVNHFLRPKYLICFLKLYPISNINAGIYLYLLDHIINLIKCNCLKKIKEMLANSTEKQQWEAKDKMSMCVDVHTWAHVWDSKSA